MVALSSNILGGTEEAYQVSWKPDFSGNWA